MIGVLDPALLLPRPGRDAELLRDLNEVNRICEAHRILLVALPEYWHRLWCELGRTLEGSSTRDVRIAVRELAKRAKVLELPPIAGLSGRVYGFEQLFGPIGTGWRDDLARAVARASLVDETVVFVRLWDGRNTTRHSAGHSSLVELTRWVLTLNLKGAPPRHVRCVYHRRNLDAGLQWTSRFDWRLPGTADGSRYPFCPPTRWWKRATPSIATIRGKPAWIDTHGNGWTRPNIPLAAGYHWDVHLTPALAAQVGLQQLNIVAYGAPAREGHAGHLHHVPKKKQQAVKSTTGWSC